MFGLLSEEYQKESWSLTRQVLFPIQLPRVRTGIALHTDRIHAPKNHGISLFGNILQQRLSQAIYAHEQICISFRKDNILFQKSSCRAQSWIFLHLSSVEFFSGKPEERLLLFIKSFNFQWKCMNVCLLTFPAVFCLKSLSKLYYEYDLTHFHFNSG